MKVWDIIIIGGGAIGSSAAYFLKKMDPSKSILLLEKRDGFGRGATGSWGSLIRVFSKYPGVSERSVNTFSYFLNFEEHVGRSCGFVQTGCLYFFSERHRGEFTKQLDILKSICKTEIHLLNAEEGRVRFPDFQWLDGDYAVYEPQGGYACPWATTEAWIEKAKEDGLDSRTTVKVQKLLTEGNRVLGVEIESGEQLSARRILLAGGAGTTRLLTHVDPVQAEARAIQVNRFHYRSSKNELPIFLDVDMRAFGRPAGRCVFYGGYLTDVESKLRSFKQPLSLSEASEAKKRLARRLKTLRTSELAGGIRALEMYSKTNDPVLGFSAQYGNLYVATGWSCTGFTLSPYYGERIASEMLGSFN